MAVSSGKFKGRTCSALAVLSLNSWGASVGRYEEAFLKFPVAVSRDAVFDTESSVGKGRSNSHLRDGWPSVGSALRTSGDDASQSPSSANSLYFHQHLRILPRPWFYPFVFINIPEDAGIVANSFVMRNIVGYTQSPCFSPFVFNNIVGNTLFLYPFFSLRSAKSSGLSSR